MAEKISESELKEKIVQELLEDHNITEMVKFNELNVQEKLEEVTFKIVKYRELYYAEKMKLDELEDKFERLCGKRYDHYRFNFDKELTKVEIEKYYLPKDEIVVQMKRIVRRQEVKTRFFEVCYKGFEKMQWSMKTFSENIRSGV